MELPNIGNNCSHPNCNKLDFLPLQCKCEKLFCTEHFNKHVETCASHAHEHGEIKKIDEVYYCSEPHCRNTSIVPLICEKCNRHFCITHRHIVECSKPDAAKIAAAKEKYAAPVRKFNEAKLAVDKQIDSNLMNLRKKTKNQVMANKVQLMRIKNKATGLKTVPTVDRIYFNIHYGDKLEKTSPVFVSKLWSLGRAIDAVAVELKIPNNNNKSDALKLRLFKKDDGQILSQDLAYTLQQLIQDQIISDGESLILKHVNNDCVNIDVE